MSWFSKKEEKVERKDFPRLAELPELPKLPDIDEDYSLPKLPIFPSNSLGDKFSQNTIKEAVTGKKEDGGVFADEFEDDELPRMQEPLKRPMTKERPFSKMEVPEEFEHASKIVKNAEPVFIRIDKFEESLKIFEKAKHQIAEIEKGLKDIKELKEMEEKELSSWENEIKNIKDKIEKINSEIFSKIE